MTQNTKRFVRCFWALDRELAYARHYPAINWITSYSEYADELDGWYNEHLGPNFVRCRRRISSLMQEEAGLMEIVKLIGSDILPEDQKLVIETARIIRTGFLQQNSFHPIDTYVPLEKQLHMMETILRFYDRAGEIVARNIPISQLRESGISDALVRMKYDIPNDDMGKFAEYRRKIDDAVNAVLAQN